MKIERSGWAAAVGTQYVLMNGRVVQIDEYRAYYAPPGSSKAAYASEGVNEVIEGRQVAAGGEDSKVITWDASGNSTSHAVPDFNLKEQVIQRRNAPKT